MVVSQIIDMLHRLPKIPELLLSILSPGHRYLHLPPKFMKTKISFDVLPKLTSHIPAENYFDKTGNQFDVIHAERECCKKEIGWLAFL